MIYPFRDPSLGAFFGLSFDYAKDREQLYEYPNLITVLWNRGADSAPLEIDGISYELKSQQMLTLTYLHQVSFPRNALPLTAFTFNREFYCIVDHDQEVSCNGIIFFGSSDVPIISLPEREQGKFELLLEVFLDEFLEKDRVQGEMMRLLLKRLIIKTTRLAKTQQGYHQLNDQQTDMVRKFKVLVDMHFRKKKQVSEYADLLFKSPKTLANAFAQLGHPSPSQLIHNRVILEAKRLLRFSELSAKEIAFELGYAQATSFNKLFKRETGDTPIQFRDRIKGKNGQSVGKSDS